MNKNKNPLKDLDQFLKQQASTLINPPSLSEKVQPTETITAQAAHEISNEQLVARLKEMAEKDRSAFYDLLIKLGEKLHHADEKMLINTALYLKGGDRWKDLVKEYWSKR